MISTISNAVKLDCKLYSVITNHYKFIRVCGHGKFGTVREATKIHSNKY